MAAARKNYRYIMSAVHPDKCNSVHANTVSKLVTHAFHTLSNPRKRVYYLNHGVPSYQESYDNIEAEEIVKHMKFILDKYERDREDELSFERSKKKRAFDDFFAQSLSRSNGNDDSVFKESIEPSMKRCKRGSGSNFSTDIPCNSNNASSAFSNQGSIHNNHSSGPSSGKIDPPLIIIDDNFLDSYVSQAKDQNPLLDSFPSQENVPKSPEAGPQEKESPSPDISQKDDLDKDVDEANLNTEIPYDSRRTFNDAATSTEKRAFVDASTSPFKPGDNFIFYVIPDSAIFSSRRNLNDSFDTSL